MINYKEYPQHAVEDVVRLRRRIEKTALPSKTSDNNLIVGTWNIRAFGNFFDDWTENQGSPKRNLRGLAYIAEIIRQFDVIAIQEVKRDTTGIRYLLNNFLGRHWDIILSDVTVGDKGNTERMAYLYDTRRVLPSGLASEIVLPVSKDGNLAEQFDRTPYIAGFKTATEKFTLLSAHIRYGHVPEDRIGELTKLAEFTAREIRDRITTESEEQNLIVLGDFNIDKREDNPLFQAFISQGLVVPWQLCGLKTTYATEPKFYDQIAWFLGAMEMEFSGRAGVIDFVDAVFPEMSRRSMSYRVSDHFPLWVEFVIDRSKEQIAEVLGVDPGHPDPFSVVPD